MATMTEKLKIYKAANATTYTANIYTTKEEALDSPIMVDVNGTIGYIAADTNPPAAVALPLYAEKDGVTYQAMEAGYVSGEQTFTASGTFTVPVGVTKIYVTASAGGGGGSAGLYNGYMDTLWNDGNGGAGGNTILGDNIIFLQGGGGGRWQSRGSGIQGIYTNGTSYASTAVHSSYGGGGIVGLEDYNGGNNWARPSAGNGGRGANCSNQEIDVTPGQTLTVTIGSGGRQGNNASHVNCTGSAGQNGYMHIRW